MKRLCKKLFKVTYPRIWLTGLILHFQCGLSVPYTFRICLSIYVTLLNETSRLTFNVSNKTNMILIVDINETNYQAEELLEKTRNQCPLPWSIYTHMVSFCCATATADLRAQDALFCWKNTSLTFTNILTQTHLQLSFIIPPLSHALLLFSLKKTRLMSSFPNKKYWMITYK